jgi:hypothetical protein
MREKLKGKPTYLKLVQWVEGKDKNGLWYIEIGIGRGGERGTSRPVDS